MNTLRIRTGEIKLAILDDDGEQRGIFRFNPEDIHAAQKVMEIQKELPEKQKEFENKITSATETEEQVKLLNEFVEYFEGLIDTCFGEGSSKLLFGDYKTISMFSDFFDGIAPYYEKASKDRIAKYKKLAKSSK